MSEFIEFDNSVLVVKNTNLGIKIDESGSNLI